MDECLITGGKSQDTWAYPQTEKSGSWVGKIQGTRDRCRCRQFSEDSMLPTPPHPWRGNTDSPSPTDPCRDCPCSQESKAFLMPQESSWVLPHVQPSLSTSRGHPKPHPAKVFPHTTVNEINSPGALCTSPPESCVQHRARASLQVELCPMVALVTRQVLSRGT